MTHDQSWTANTGEPPAELDDKDYVLLRYRDGIESIAPKRVSRVSWRLDGRGSDVVQWRAVRFGDEPGEVA